MDFWEHIKARTIWKIGSRKGLSYQEIEEKENERLGKSKKRYSQNKKRKKKKSQERRTKKKKKVVDIDGWLLWIEKNKDNTYLNKSDSKFLNKIYIYRKIPSKKQLNKLLDIKEKLDKL